MYRTIETCFWTDPKIRKLEHNARNFLFFLITNPMTHVGGIYNLPMENIRSWFKPPDGYPIDTLFDTLSAKDLAHYDLDREIVFVVNMFRHQGRGKKNHISAAKHLRELHNSPLINKFLEAYPECIPYAEQYGIDRVSLARAGDQDQEQEQEQEQEQKKTRRRKRRRRPRTPAGEASTADAAETAPDPPKDPPVKTRPKPPGDPDVRRCCELWLERYRGELGIADEVNTPPWTKREFVNLQQVKKALANTGKTLPDVFAAYLANEDDFFAGHPPGKLLNQLSQFMVLAKAPWEVTWERLKPTLPAEYVKILEKDPAAIRMMVEDKN